ncbi:hypothetical protein AVEN_39665-1 [Araneus ventricosus]|uniref:Transposable element Tc3 transposase n=1 Tax=Araneus ventricosus TaxID=182803 RepID=A0A4Y2TEA4_ARAVE|nr:hypothetical protein AVEN_39665-1 [Araneus ventricosus]
MKAPLLVKAFLIRTTFMRGHLAIPYDTLPHAYQKRFSVHVWAGIVGDHLIGPYLQPFRMDRRTCLTFLQQVLPELLQPVAANIQAGIWFQHDGAPPHFILDVRRALDAKFPRRWIGRGGPTHWTAHSPDISSLDFFLWGRLRSLVYESPIDFDKDLVARISVAAGAIREMPAPSEKCRVCLKKCDARYIAGVTPALPQVVALLSSLCNFATHAVNKII